MGERKRQAAAVGGQPSLQSQRRVGVVVWAGTAAASRQWLVAVHAALRPLQHATQTAIPLKGPTQPRVLARQPGTTRTAGFIWSASMPSERALFGTTLSVVSTSALVMPSCCT